MNKIGDCFLKKYVDEYIQYGMQCGFFDYRRANELKPKLLNMNVTIQDNLPGDANCNGNLLTINSDIFQRNDDGRFASFILFHEFTHVCSNVNAHRFNNGLFIKLNRFVENHPERIDTTYQDMFCTTKIGDINNPYTYIEYGALVIDEVTAEYVATEIAKMKYRDYVPLINGERVYGNGKYRHRYRCHFEYYGVAEELMQQFSKTLFLKNKSKNLNGLATEIFKERFVYDLIRQHNENPTAFQHLIDELAFLGVIGIAEEQHYGRSLRNGPISASLVRNSFENLQQIFEYGREDREDIPGYIPAPML